jgi:hypothetical protein
MVGLNPDSLMDSVNWEVGDDVALYYDEWEDLWLKCVAMFASEGALEGLATDGPAWIRSRPEWPAIALKLKNPDLKYWLNGDFAAFLSAEGGDSSYYSDERWLAALVAECRDGGEGIKGHFDEYRDGDIFECDHCNEVVACINDGLPVADEETGEKICLKCYDEMYPNEE